MNKIDIDNIKKELKKRNAANYKWSEGGEMVKDDIMLRTTNELKQLLKDFENNKNSQASVNVKKLVDYMFETYGEDGDNMIALTAAYCPERKVYDQDPLEEIYFSDDEYNTLYKPICRNWDCGSYWERQDKDKETLKIWGEKWDKYHKDLCKLVNEYYKLSKAVSAEEYWKNDNEALNECWYGVIGIMKDYRVVAFVIRDDGMLCDNDKYESFNNSILFTL